MVASEKKKAYDKNFNKEKTVMRGIRFNKDTDKKLLEWLELHKPYSNYIKLLIEKDMKENQK